MCCHGHHHSHEYWQFSWKAACRALFLCCWRRSRWLATQTRIDLNSCSLVASFATVLRLNVTGNFIGCVRNSRCCLLGCFGCSFILLLALLLLDLLLLRHLWLFFFCQLQDTSLMCSRGEMCLWIRPLFPCDSPVLCPQCWHNRPAQLRDWRSSASSFCCCYWWRLQAVT